MPNGTTTLRLRPLGGLSFTARRPQVVDVTVPDELNGTVAYVDQGYALVNVSVAGALGEPPRLEIHGFAMVLACFLVVSTMNRPVSVVFRSSRSRFWSGTQGFGVDRPDNFTMLGYLHQSEMSHEEIFRQDVHFPVRFKLLRPRFRPFSALRW